MTTGERIRHRRQELNMSQEELASKLGYKHKSSINKIEMGVHNLTQSKIASIASALDTTPSYIMGWDDLEEEKQANKNLERFMELLEPLSEEEQERLFNIMKMIINERK